MERQQGPHREFQVSLMQTKPNKTKTQTHISIIPITLPLTVKNLIVPRIGHDEIPILGPVKVSDKTGVSLGNKSQEFDKIATISHLQTSP